MMLKKSLLLLLAASFLLPQSGIAQTVPKDSLGMIELMPVVVTATRTAKELKDVAVPTTVVTAQEIEAQGAVRLSDVLEELTGLMLTEDHGTGIQVQGFSPDYTLILIDGEPVIGRTAGTLELDRLTVAGIDRVEIVRGPSSSLYGSEALAGVINLITRPPAGGISSSFRTRYGTHRNADLTASVEAAGNRVGGRVLINRYSSAGYDLSPDVFGPTAPSFTDYTADARLHFHPSDRTTFKLSSRIAAQDQQNAFALIADGAQVPHDESEERVEWSLHPEVRHRFSNKIQSTASIYAARYTTDLHSAQQSTGTTYSEDHFDQRYGKAEVQVNALWNTRHLTVLGAGAVTERLGGDRYSEARPQAQSAFLYAQHEWFPSRYFDVNVSARLDRHSEYAARLSPKASVLFKPLENWRIRASVGSGFKAPDFRQLYLTFTNAAAGYDVLGSTQVIEGLERLQEAGQIAEVLIDPTTLEIIRAENSLAFNLGVSGTPLPWLEVSVNGFRNDVEDMIETQPIAQKVNGSFVYGYFNLNKIYTQGIETEATLFPGQSLSFTAGYQFLQARDPEIVDAIRDGQVFTRDASNRDRRVTLSEYGGLLGRSKHSGLVRATYTSPKRGLTATLRGIYRGRYGYRDSDGNGIPNRSDEFVPGYMLFHATLSKDFAFSRTLERVRLQVGADNLFDLTRPSLIPSMPGRTIYAGLQFYL